MNYIYQKNLKFIFVKIIFNFQIREVAGGLHLVFCSDHLRGVTEAVGVAASSGMSFRCVFFRGSP
jgi:hypothetical protein